MLPNWLTGSQQGQSDGNADERHVVLGTPLKAPLMEDQEEMVSAGDGLLLQDLLQLVEMPEWVELVELGVLLDLQELMVVDL